MKPQAYAAIDIGSNTFRLMIAHQAAPEHPTPWHIEAYTHRIIRLGEGLHEHGQLCDAAMQRAMSAFHEFATLLHQHHIDAEHTYAVATSAMREARNGHAFCQQVAQETGIQVHIIAGEEEARLSLLGSGAVLPPDIRQNFLLFDIGGGSTEFVRAQHHTVHDAISRTLGVVRLVEAHLHSNPPSHDDYQAMKDTCLEHLQAVETHWHNSNGHRHTPPALVGTAGTVTTLAAVDLDMHCYDADIINQHSISRSRFHELKQQLLSMSLTQRQNLAAIEEGRADLMVAGIAIIDTILEHWDYDTLRIVDAGLLEGAWLSFMQPEQT